MDSIAKPINLDPGPVAQLESAGLAVRPRWPWVHVGSVDRQEGWKIHLSCTPNLLSKLIQKVIVLRMELDFVFKVIESREAAMILNEGSFGSTQVGKCITIYPDSTQAFEQLVERLVEIQDIDGPAIRDDVKLGKVVYGRFGSFNPIIRRDALGQMQQLIQDNSGDFIPDVYDKALNQERFDRDFSGSQLQEYEQSFSTTPTDVLNGRYAIIDVLKDSAKGCLLQCIDLWSKKSVRALIIKQGRAFVFSDNDGHDIRDRLQHQERMHKRASTQGIVPPCDPYFEVDGDGYLAMEFQSNDNFEAWIQLILGSKTIDVASPEVRTRIFSRLAKIGRLIDQLHDLGIVHRDISPSNILMDHAENPLISDLEIAWTPGQKVIYGKGTPGFMAPEQADGASPSPEADVHAFAALILYALTGIDPRRLPVPAQSDGWRSLKRMCTTVPISLWRKVRQALSPVPENRPSLAVLCEALESASLNVAVTAPPSASPVPWTPGFLNEAVESLASPAYLAGSLGVWLSAPMEAAGPPSAEIRRSLNRGCSGPLYLCAQYQQESDLPDSLRTLCQRTAGWLISDRDAPDFGMPGLQFGEAGVLLALYSARGSGLIEFSNREVDHLWDKVLQPEHLWLDFTHGCAGVNSASVLLEPLLNEQDPDRLGCLRTLRTDSLQKMISHQNEDGSWTVPPGVNGLSGQVLTGFAHGVAGIAYSLLTTPADECREDVLAAAIRAGDWLISQSYSGAEGSLAWLYSDLCPEKWIWWCHGAPGIAQLFAVLFAQTGEERYRDIALNCFAGTCDGVNPANLSLCHGAAGLGELMLDTGHLCADGRLIKAAQSLGERIAARHFRGKQDIYWIVENTELTSADLMVGVSGILHFLLRLQTGSTAMTFPTLVPEALWKSHR